jgi:hypothetical protein
MSSVRAALVLLACAAPSVGCVAPKTAEVAREGRVDDASRVRALEEAEDEVLRDLAAIDRRFALRARITPRDDDLRRVAMAAVFAEDQSLAVVDGAIDPFSFDARARGLAAVKKKLAAIPRDLPRAAPGMTPAPALEHELLVRLVGDEEARLDEERALPRSASSLVRAIVETWTLPSSPALAAERDRWLSRRLAEVRVSLGAATDEASGLDVVRARELDDALDALEHLVDAPGLNGATAELVKLRDALEAQGTRPAMRARDDWPKVSRRVQAHLGIAVDPATLDRRLADAQGKVRAAAERATAAAKLEGDALGARVSAAMFGATPCVDAVAGSRVRSMAPPPERGPVCRLRHVLTAATDDASRAVALATMHDDIVVARWAIAVAHGEGTIAELAAKHRLFVRSTPDVTARLERAALARPVSAIAAGVAAAMLIQGDDPIARARAWTALGEVPLDVAERELTKR